MSSEQRTGVRNDLRKFVETTSLRGVSRIFKSTDLVLRILWALAVAFCAAMMVFQLSSVINQYLRYEFSTVTKEDIWSHTSFPDVTICNIYPFGHDDGDETLTWSAYKAAMTVKKQQWPYERLKLVLSNLTVAEYDDIWKDLSSHLGVATNMMPDVTNQQRTSQSQQLIVDCLLFNKDWYETAVNCKSTLHFHWDQTYQQCYTIRIPRNITQDILGLTAIIYLDNLWPPTDVDQEFHANIRHSLATGARVAVQAPTTLPYMKRGITVSPGVETTIEVTQVHRKRLSQPWGTCTAEQYLVTPEQNDGEGVRYTSESCSEICKQDQYIDRCRCVIPILAFTDEQLRRTNQTICMGQTAENGRFPTSPMDRRDGLRTLLCLLRTNDTEIKPCSCPLPCDEDTYDVAVSTSGPWPHQSYRMAFYDKFISGKRHGERLNRFANEKVQKFLSKLRSTSSGITTWNMFVINKPTVLLNTSLLTLISDNFLQLNVVLKRKFPLVVQDKEAMTTQILLSNIGGVLSLWLGLTVMFFVEIFDLIICIFRKCKH